MPPGEHHLELLVNLSQSFASEHSWAAAIPIGKIDSIELARQNLLGDELVAARVAETAAGELAGYAGIYRNPEGHHISILIERAFRRSGVGKQLVEAVFEEAPAGLLVEAWVGDFNVDSLQATPKLGFLPDRILKHNENTVHIFVRQS